MPIHQLGKLHHSVFFRSRPSALTVLPLGALGQSSLCPLPLGSHLDRTVASHLSRTSSKVSCTCDHTTLQTALLADLLDSCCCKRTQHTASILPTSCQTRGHMPEACLRGFDSH